MKKKIIKLSGTFSTKKKIQFGNARLEYDVERKDLPRILAHKISALQVEIENIDREERPQGSLEPFDLPVLDKTFAKLDDALVLLLDHLKAGSIEDLEPPQGEEWKTWQSGE